ncbi:hypothetical protein IAT38_007943 [Cryptococcus sp. DSM 104549]
MAQAVALPPQSTPSPPTSLAHSDLHSPAARTRSRLSSTSTSPPPPARSTRSRSAAPTPAPTADNKENIPVDIPAMSGTSKKGGKSTAVEDGTAAGSGNGIAGQTWRDGSLEQEDGVPRVRKNPPRSARPSGANGLATLPTIPDPEAEVEADVAARSGSAPGASELAHPLHPHAAPPPAASTQTGTGDRPVVTRKRRSSSVKRKPSPGVTPTKAVDWEIPRKTFHSSIGFLTLYLNYLQPRSLVPLISVLTAILVTVSVTDFFRLRFPAFAEVWELYLGFLMRESERQKINGVVWYLIGVIFVLSLYPRDVAVVSILTLSWSDTTASTIGRLWGRYTPPLPAHVPGIKALRFAPRKSLAGFLAASITSFLICITFWWNGSGGRWTVLDVEDYGHGFWGLWVTAGVVGVGGAVVEALDLGIDDNLTLPILSGAIAWAWLSFTNAIL